MTKFISLLLNRRGALALTAVAAAMLAFPTFSLAKDLVSKTNKGVAIKGYDTTA